MARGFSIIVTADPNGRREEGIVSGSYGTIYPGMLVEPVPGVVDVSGRKTWRPIQRADGVLGPIAVALEDGLQGKLGVGAVGAGVSSGGSSVAGNYGVGDAYVAGTRLFVYWPLPGDALNLLVKDVAGSADTITVGDLYGVDGTNHGYLKKNSSFATAPFEAMETLPAMSADTVVWFQYNGA